MKFGYARMNTVQQDLRAQLDAPRALDVNAKSVHVGHGLTRTSSFSPSWKREPNE